MRQLVVVLMLGFLAYARANDTLEAGGPYDWNNFLKEVETTCKNVEVFKDKIEKEISSDPTVRSNQRKEVDQMLTQIILIQNMITKEFKYRDALDTLQKNLLETWKNKALRLRQELIDLKKKLSN